jgi:hypothetical protein
MGNPRGVTTTNAPNLTGDNGILPALPADIISDGMGRLPRPDLLPNETRSVELEAGSRGMVRITYLSKRLKSHGHSWWVWLPKHAAAIASPE